MYKKINKILILVITSLYVLSYNTFICKAEEIEQKDIQNNLTPSKNENYKDYDYVIDKYDIDIIVNEDNSYDITETITAYFNEERHGIVRQIPLKNNIRRLDGTKSKNHAIISNLNINDKFSIERGNGKYEIKIGNKSNTVIGEKNYIIKYKYSLSKDKTDKFDELYLNIIGTEWDTAIGNITFEITMPKYFDSSKLGFSSGLKGSIENNKVKYNIDGNIITGSYDGILDKNKGLTIRCELPNAYFKNNKFFIMKKIIFDLSYFLSLCYKNIFCFILLMISIIIWYKNNKNKKIIETIEFYPPEGLNSLDVGFIYKGKVEKKDIISLLIYLANKGYINILNNENGKYTDYLNTKLKEKQNKKAIELNEKKQNRIKELQNKISIEKNNNPNSNKIKYYENMIDTYKNQSTPTYKIEYDCSNVQFIIRKLKDYDGSNFSEQLFMDGLFNGRDEVTDEMLQDDFYWTYETILEFNAKKEDELYEKKNNKILLFVMITILYAFITYKFIPLETLAITLFFQIMGTIAMFLFKKMSHKISITVYFDLLLFILAPLIIVGQNSVSNLIEYIIGILCIIVIYLCLTNAKKRTPKTNKIFGKIKGFKRFLETVEKDKLEAMVNETPTYFYDILPYAYVLGISDKWIKKFESISIQSPNWYNSQNTFDMTSFKSFINNTITSTQSAMTSSPSVSSSDGYSGGYSGGSSGGGGHSGGGSSGGGSGGGGGHSW